MAAEMVMGNSEAKGNGAGGRKRKPDLPWYRKPEAVAQRKEKSRKALELEGGRELRVRLDREGNEALEEAKAHYRGLDNGGIVRKALVALAASFDPQKV